MKYIKIILINIFALVFSAVVLFVLYQFSNCKNIAYADASNVSSYEEAKVYFEQTQVEYDTIMNQANTIYNSIEETKKDLFESQNEMIIKQSEFNQVIKYQYVNCVKFNLIYLIISSGDIDDLVRNVQYVNSITDQYYKLSLETKQRRDAFQNILNDFNSQIAYQNKLLVDAQNKINEAKQVMDSLKDKLQKAEMAKLENIAKSIPNNIQDDPVNPSPSPSPSPDPAPPVPEINWQSGIASAYGGSSDPSTGAISTTATGDICDDSSMGVALPMSLPGYRNYFHHTIQISLNGYTVVGIINDCGYMGGGSRSLDLQPGIFHAFGYSTCQAWGLRRVDYLII